MVHRWGRESRTSSRPAQREPSCRIGATSAPIRPGARAARQDDEWLDFARRAAADPSLPFEIHWSRFQEIFAGRPAEDGPPAAWRPVPEAAASANLAWLLREAGAADYAGLHAWSAAHREAFWELAIRRLGIVFSRPPARILDPGRGAEHAAWLPGAAMNCAASCFGAPASRAAVVAGREGSRALAVTTYGGLRRTSAAVAAGLRASGVASGDAVAFYLPLTAECVAAYLGAVLAGCRVVSIAESFAAAEVARRLAIAGARSVLTVDRFARGGRTFDLYDVVREAGAERAVVAAADPAAPPALRRGDLHWRDLLARGGAAGTEVACDPGAVTNVLFSSGTTATPKAIPWTHLTPIKAAMDGCFHHDLRPGDVVAWPTSIGWMMGPWLIYAALVNGATIALYEGSPAGPGFARFVEDAGVTVLGVVPSLVRAWRAAEATAGADWSRVRVFSSTGEASSREDSLWLMSRAGYRAPVVEYCGGTEIGGGYVTGTVVQPASPSTFTTAALGLDFLVLDERGREVGAGETGEVFLVPPSIGLSETLLGHDHHEVYYAGCPAGPGGETLRRHGDRFARLHGGGFRAQGRSDDAMNLGGVKVAALELERVLTAHAAVVECAAVGVQPEGEGAEKLVVYAVPRGRPDAGSLKADLDDLLRRRLNPLFRIHDLVLKPALPRTASNKLMRRELKSEYLEGRAMLE